MAVELAVFAAGERGGIAWQRGPTLTGWAGSDWWRGNLFASLFEFRAWSRDLVIRNTLAPVNFIMLAFRIRKRNMVEEYCL